MYTERLFFRLFVGKLKAERGLNRPAEKCHVYRNEAFVTVNVNNVSLKAQHRSRNYPDPVAFLVSHGNVNDIVASRDPVDEGSFLIADGQDDIVSLENIFDVQLRGVYISSAAALAVLMHLFKGDAGAAVRALREKNDPAVRERFFR